MAAGSCSSTPAETVSSDAGVERSKPGVEGSTVDGAGDLDSALPNADPVPDFTTGWSRVPWAPECALYQPNSPATWGMVSPVHWQACSSGRAGCQELVLDWAPAKYSRTVSVSGALSPSGSVRLSFTRIYSPYQREYLVWDADVGVVAVWRNDGNFNCVEVVLGDVGAGAYVLTESIKVPPSTTMEYRQLLGTPSEVQAKAMADYSFVSETIGFSSLDFMSQSSGSSSVIDMFFGQDNRLALRDRVSGIVSKISDRAGAGGVQEFQWVVNDAILYSRGNEIDVWRPSTGEVPLIQRTTTSAHDIATDGTALAWIESTGLTPDGFFAGSTLFVSPYTTDPAQVVPRRLNDPGCPYYVCGTKMTSGYVLNPSWVLPATVRDASLAITRLSDGAFWRLAPVNSATYSEGWDHPGFILNGELWQSWLDRKSNGAKFGIQRIRLDSLGAPGHD